SSLLSTSCVLLLLYTLYFSLSVDHRLLHSFPTRRSSDLIRAAVGAVLAGEGLVRADALQHTLAAIRPGVALAAAHAIGHHLPVRSEEHTSELQSRFDIVCRLLLEKKQMRMDYMNYLFNMV